MNREEKKTDCEKGIAGELRTWLAIRYAVEGDLRFISHQDSLRLFKRALARADIPVRYSEGFNPRPKLRIALPRTVGVASQDELLMIELNSEEDPARVLSQLSAHVPYGMRLLSIERPDAGDRRLPAEVEYALAIEPGEHGPAQEGVSRFLAQEAYVVTRDAAGGKSERSVDIRGFVKTMAVQQNAVQWTQEVSQAGTARISEVLDAIGLSAIDHLHKVVRRRVSYQA